MTCSPIDNGEYDIHQRSRQKAPGRNLFEVRHRYQRVEEPRMKAGFIEAQVERQATNSGENGTDALD